MGRPTAYTDELADEFCRRLVGASEREVCEADDMPGRETVRQWRRVNESFRAKCACAREDQGHAAVDDMAELERQTLDGTIRPDAARVVLSSMQWRASKLAKAHYGDRLELAGSVGNRPVEERSEAELLALLSQLEAAKPKTE